MGIPGFTRYLLKQNLFRSEFNNKKKNKWDFLILDFQSLLYTYYNILTNEINFFIRYLFCLKYNFIDMNKNNSDWIIILNYIIDTHEIYFNKIRSTDYFKKQLNKNKFDDLLSFNFNDSELIINTLTNYIINHTKYLAKNHIIQKDKYSRTFIFFDGIPSMAKIKEQIGRRLYPDVIKEIINNYLNDNDIKNNLDINEKNIRNKLLSEFPPSIGLNSDLINNIRKKFNKIKYDKILGKFKINKINYGEAEHQIMTYISNNNKIFKNKKILIASPDADLIILAFINSINNINIDIYNEHQLLTFARDFNYKIIKNRVISPFIKEYYYINTLKIKKYFNLNNQQKVNDISFILLLLGDDFLPKISSIDIDDI